MKLARGQNCLGMNISLHSSDLCFLSPSPPVFPLISASKRCSRGSNTMWSRRDDFDRRVSPKLPLFVLSHLGSSIESLSSEKYLIESFVLFCDSLFSPFFLFPLPHVSSSSQSTKPQPDLPKTGSTLPFKLKLKRIRLRQAFANKKHSSLNPFGR